MTTDGRALDPGFGAAPAGVALAPHVARPSGRRLRLRHLYLVPALVLAFYANAKATEYGLGLAPVLIFGIVPHLPALLGIGQPHAPGQMAARAIPLFNVMHHPAPPLVVLALALAGVLSPFWFVSAVAWSSHIVGDLAFDKGLRTADGWRRGWWTVR